MAGRFFPIPGGGLSALPSASVAASTRICVSIVGPRQYVARAGAYESRRDSWVFTLQAQATL